MALFSIFWPINQLLSTPCDTSIVEACQGEILQLEAKFSAAFGSAAYDWERSNDGVNYQPMAGANSIVLTIGFQLVSGTFFYRATATNRRNHCKINHLVILTVNPSPGNLIVSGTEI